MSDTTDTTGGIAPYTKDALDEKIVREFPGKIVRKDLTSLMKRGANVPTFVLEYLLGTYCATDDEALIEEGVGRIRRILTENYVRPDESEKIKSRIRELGQYNVIDKVDARLDEYDDIYVGSFTNLNIGDFVMPEEYVRNYSKMLTGGIWCIMRIQYLRPEDEMDALDDIFDDDTKKKPRRSRSKSKKRGPQDSPFRIVKLTPIQMPNLDLEELISHRQAFTTDEWICLLLRSAGYEPDALTRRERLHFLERMVPLIERNYNLVELGPRGTGKSHIYTEVSPYSYLLSGGQTTTAKLFASNNTRRGTMGLVGHWDAIAFDEVAGMNFKDMNAVQIMKGYMANGTFGRGTDSYNAEASMVFEGNINDTVANVLKTTHLFDPFPPEFNNDSAFFDRIHCYLPGWEVPKLRGGPAHAALRPHHGLPGGVLQGDAQARLHPLRRRVLPPQRRGQQARRDRHSQDLLRHGQAHLPGRRGGQGRCRDDPRVRDRGPSPREGAAQDHGGHRVRGREPGLHRP